MALRHPQPRVAVLARVLELKVNAVWRQDWFWLLVAVVLLRLAISTATLWPQMRRFWQEF